MILLFDFQALFISKTVYDVRSIHKHITCDDRNNHMELLKLQMKKGTYGSFTLDCLVRVLSIIKLSINLSISSSEYNKGHLNFDELSTDTKRQF